MASRKSQPHRPSSQQSRRGYRPAAPTQGAGSAASRGYTPQPAALGKYSRNNPAYAQASRKRGRGKKIGIGIVASLLLVLVGAGTAFALYINGINEALSGNATAEERMAIKDTLVPTKTYTEPFYMMLIGSDARDGDPSAGARSDTNIVARIDPVGRVVTLLSIPRDTKTDIDGYGTEKFNAIYNYDGVPGVIREASQLCGVDIAHYADVNFERMIQLIDAVGGVEVDVPELIDDPDAGNIVIQPGVQTLNGEAALVFARSRAYFDGDFSRVSNQRRLVEGLINKVLSLSPLELPGVIQSAAACVNTDMSVNDIFSLASQFKNTEGLTMYSAMVPSTILPLDAQGVSYVGADQAALAEMMRVIDAGGDPASVVTTLSSVDQIIADNEAAAAALAGEAAGTGTSGTSG